jgi:hypothetical protein
MKRWRHKANKREELASALKGARLVEDCRA